MPIGTNNLPGGRSTAQHKAYGYIHHSFENRSPYFRTLQSDRHLNFANRQINVDNQLLKDSETGYCVDEPKTKKSIQQITMSDKVYKALKRAVKNRGKEAATLSLSERAILSLEKPEGD